MYVFGAAAVLASGGVEFAPACLALIVKLHALSYLQGYKSKFACEVPFGRGGVCCPKRGTPLERLFQDCSQGPPVFREASVRTPPGARALCRVFNLEGFSAECVYLESGLTPHSTLPLGPAP